VRRAVIATAGTVAGLVLLLGYKSGAPGKVQKVAVTGGSSAPVGTTPATAPATTPAIGPPTSAPSSAPTSAPTSAPSAASATTCTGQLVTYFYGDIKVAATFKGGRIVNITVPQNDGIDPRSQMINSQAVPILEQEALSAQSLNFNVVSGATYTSDAFAQSLQTALQQARK
jgi:uncharacterized protein with FMN-binding domain